MPAARGKAGVCGVMVTARLPLGPAEAVLAVVPASAPAAVAMVAVLRVDVAAENVAGAEYLIRFV